MAVSFKVPKSPKRDIFTIDTFLGVDLTNTGSNIDDVRSPNAENMVRFVPGKVRKRTGYQTKIDFSSGDDVNRAIKTSDAYIDCPFDENGVATYSIYETKLNSVYVALNIDAVGSYQIRLYGLDGTYMQDTFSGTEECPFTSIKGWFAEDFVSRSGFKYMEIRKTSNDEEDYCRIANLRICNSSSATIGQDWLALPWTPAPEDTGIIDVDAETTKPVYGCHMIKSGTFTGDRVVNVNRALNTSKSFQTFTCDDSGNTDIYYLAEQLYVDDTQYIKTPVYVEFDYVSDGEAYMYIAGQPYGTTVIHNTNGEIDHCSFAINAGSFSNYSCAIRAVLGTVSVSIKNFAVMYEKNDAYTWGQAPEDTNETFHIEDIYNIDSSNYAVEDSYYSTETAVNNMATIRADITNSSSNVRGFAHIGFDLYTASDKNVSKIEVKLANDTDFLYASSKIYNEHLNSKHIDFYVSANAANKYVKSVYVYIYVKSGNGNCTARLTNITVNMISLKSNYTVSSMHYIYHVGDSLYLRASNSNVLDKIYTGANEHLSRSWQLNNKLYILDGQQIYSYQVGDIEAKVVSQGDGFIPLVTIGKSPDGGGTPYQSLNLLQPGFYEQFTVDDDTKTAKNFQLSFRDLDDTKTKVWLLDDNGNWVQKTEGTDYSVNRGSGIITFVTAPGASPLTGEDNVKVLAYRTVEGYADRICKCTTGILFGVGGAADRLFLSGNPEYPNWDFYSEQYDPTYFPDTGYSALGSVSSAIIGYAIVNNYLATFKDEFDTSQAVFIREGDLEIDQETKTSEPTFKLINTLQGNGIIAPYAIGYLQTEPLFLTRSGIYAITAQDITGEKYSQNRSFYLNGYLTKEANLENSVAAVYNDQYILAINNKLYILDGLQATRTDKSEPYSTRQYAGFYCTNVPAVSIWTDSQALWIGTTDGKVCRFATDIESLESYNDNGEPIYCCWETPELDGHLFYKNKTFRYFATRLMHAIRTSIKIYSRKLGTWGFIKEETINSGVFFENFDFNNVDFNVRSYSSDLSEKVVHTKVRVKKVDKARFKVENGNINEPFGIFDLALEYIESGNYKG